MGAIVVLLIGSGLALAGPVTLVGVLVMVVGALIWAIRWEDALPPPAELPATQVPQPPV